MKTRPLRFCGFPALGSIKVDSIMHHFGLRTTGKPATPTCFVRLALCWLNPHLGDVEYRGHVMIEPEFERLSRQIGLIFYDIAFDLTERGVVHAESSPRQPRDGCLLTIKKSGSPLEQAGGSFAVKDDPEPATVRIEIADTRIAAGQPRVEQIPAAEITTDTIRERIRRFVDEWLAE